MTLRVVCGIRVNGSVNGSADSDTIAEKKGVDDGKYEPNGAWNDGARLELERRAQDEL